MAQGYFPLPAFRVPSGIDFEPVSNALTDLGNARAREQQMAQQNRNALFSQAMQTSANSRAQESHAAEMEMLPLKREMQQAQVAKLRREANGQGDLPANVREWNEFNRLSPSDQERYLSMKRANKYLDLGDSFVQPSAVNPTASPQAQIPKNLAAAEAQKATGEAVGKAKVDLPRVQTMHDRLLRQIEDVEKSDLGRVTGWMGHLPTLRPESVDVEEKAGQLTGGAFLQAFEALKGGGQITEIEGAKATAALARLANFRQSEPGYRQALADFKSEVRNLLTLARTKAGQPGVPQEASAPAAQGDAGGWSIKRLD